MTNSSMDNLDRKDRASALAAQLEALLHNTHGEAGESFRHGSGELQDNYLWACFDLASEMRKLVDNLEVNHA